MEAVHYDATGPTAAARDVRGGGPYRRPQPGMPGTVRLVVGGHRADPLAGRRDLAAAFTGRFRRVARWTAKGITVALYGP